MVQNNKKKENRVKKQRDRKFPYGLNKGQQAEVRMTNDEEFEDSPDKIQTGYTEKAREEVQKILNKNFLNKTNVFEEMCKAQMKSYESENYEKSKNFDKSTSKLMKGIKCQSQKPQEDVHRRQQQEVEKKPA